MLLLEGSTAEALGVELGSAAEGVAQWVSSAAVAEDGELTPIADTKNEVGESCVSIVSLWKEGYLCC